MSTSSLTYQPFDEVEEGNGTSRKRFNGRSASTSQIEIPNLAKRSARRKDRMAVIPSETAKNWSSQEFDVSVCIYCMKEGTTLTKIKAQGTKSNRTYYLDEQNSCIRWKPTRKGTKAKIAVDSIKEVREGQNTDSFKRSLVNENVNSACCFSIIYGNGLETVDLVANTIQEACIWIQGVRFLLAGLQMEDMLVKSNRLRDNWLRTTFETADKSKNGLLDMDEVIKLLHKLNFKLSKRKIKKLFREADTNTIGQHEGQLDYEEFMQFYKLISTRKELLFLLQQYSQSKQYMTTEELQKFLQTEQRLASVTIAMCEEIIDKFEPVPENIENRWLGIDGFTKYLLSPEGNAFNQSHKKVHQDMTQPLSHYYMAASHNTYLVGDQLMSQSSVDIYACVLQAGCRCVELDCWDGKDGEPVIYHGYTLTTKILFRDVIETINKYAFLNNPYPVVLSIENHCSVDQQKKMAYYLGEILKDKLHATPPSEKQTHLPSPADLKEKILIKTKKLPMAVASDADTGEVTDEDSADEMEDNFKLEYSNQSKHLESIAMAQLALMQKKPVSPGRKAWQVLASKVKGQLVGPKPDDDEEQAEPEGTSRNKTPQRTTKKKRRSNRRFSSTDSGIGSEKSRDEPQESSEGSESRSRSGSKKKIIMSKMLSDLVVYTKSSSFSGFTSAPFWELPSMGEMRAMNLCTVHASQVARFTRNNLCRVYPSAYRIDSSNYNPTPMWNAGIQIVALNYQTEGRAIQLCNALFSYNGQCGYVLKPDYLCDGVFDPSCQGTHSTLQKKLLTLQVISGQQLPKPPQSLLGERGEIIDPFVEVEVIGLPCDTAKMITKTIQDNGFSPIWNSTMQFGIQAIDLALIRFAVWDEDPIGRDFIGQATLPMSSLTQGYRHIHLDGLDQATIFVNISITDFDERVRKYLRISSRPFSAMILSIKHLKSMQTKLYNRSKSAEGAATQVQLSTPRKQSLGRMFSSRRRHTISAIFNRPKPIGGAFDNLQDEDFQTKESKCLEVMLDNDETAVSNNTILEQIMASDLSTRFEEDGSVSVDISQLQCLFETISVSTLLTCIREGTLNILVNDESSGDSICRLLYQYVPLQRPMDLPISGTDEKSLRSWWNNLLQDMSEQYQRNSIASNLMLSNDDDSSSSSSSESFGELSFLSDISDTFIYGSNTTCSEGIESLQREDPEGSDWNFSEGMQYFDNTHSFELLDQIEHPKDELNADKIECQGSQSLHPDILSGKDSTDISKNRDMESVSDDIVFEDLSEFSKVYISLQNCKKSSEVYQEHSLTCQKNVGNKLDYFCNAKIIENPNSGIKDGLSQQCDDTISCISVPCNNDGEFDTLESIKQENPKIRNDFMSLECDDVISDISGSDYDSDNSSSDNSIKLNTSESSIPSASLSEGAITGDLDFEGHYNVTSINTSSNSIPEYMMQRFVPTRKQRLSRSRNYSKLQPEYTVGRSMTSASSEILCDTNQTCIKLLTPPRVKLRRSLSDRIITSSKVPFSSSVSSTLCEELMMSDEQDLSSNVQKSNPVINLNSNNSNNNDGCEGSDDTSSDKDGKDLHGSFPIHSVPCAQSDNPISSSSIKHKEPTFIVDSNVAIMPMISIDVTKDDPLWQSSDDDHDSLDSSSSSSSSEKTILDITLEDFGKKSEAMGASSEETIEIGELKIKDIFDPEEYNFYKKCFLNRLHQAQKKRKHDARRKGKKTSKNKIKRKELEKLLEQDEATNENIVNSHSFVREVPLLKDENENSILNASAERIVNFEQNLGNERYDQNLSIPGTENYNMSNTSKKELINHNPDTDYIQLHQMPDLLSNHTIEEDNQPIYENSDIVGLVDESMIQPQKVSSQEFKLGELLKSQESSGLNIDYGDYVSLRFNEQGHRLPLIDGSEIRLDSHTEQGMIKSAHLLENIYEELPDVKEKRLQMTQSMMLTNIKAHRPRPIDVDLEKMFLESLNLEPGMMYDLNDSRNRSTNRPIFSSLGKSDLTVPSHRFYHNQIEKDTHTDDVCALALRERSKQIINVMANVTSPTAVRKEHNMDNLDNGMAREDHINGTHNKARFGDDLAYSGKCAGSRRPVNMPTSNDDRESAALLRLSDARIHNRKTWLQSRSSQRVSNEQLPTQDHARNEHHVTNMQRVNHSNRRVKSSLEHIMDKNTPSFPRQDLNSTGLPQYQYHCQRLNESEEFLLENKPLRSNIDYVAFPRNRHYFKEYARTDNLYPHDYPFAKPPDAVNVHNPKMVDQATSPGVDKHETYTPVNAQRNDSNSFMPKHRDASVVSHESSQDLSVEMKMTSTPTRSCRRVLSEMRQWNLSAIGSESLTTEKIKNTGFTSSESGSQVPERSNENTASLYENMASLNQQSKQENNQNTTITGQVQSSKKSIKLSASLTASYDHTISPSTTKHHVTPDTCGIKRWYTNENMAVHKAILHQNDESEVTLDNSTPNHSQMRTTPVELTKCLPSYKDHLEKRGMSKQYSSTPSLNDDNDSVFLNDSDYDEETPPRPQLVRSVSQPENTRSSIMLYRSKSHSGMKRTKSVRFDVPGEESSDSLPSDELSNGNGEQFSIIERLVGKQSYQAILDKWAERNECGLPAEQHNTLEDDKQKSRQTVIYASPNTSYNGYTEMVDGVQIKEYADIGTHEITQKNQFKTEQFGNSTYVDQKNIPITRDTEYDHRNSNGTRFSADDIHTLSRYQMNYREMETSEFWKPIHSEDHLRHHSSSSSNMSIPSSTTDITYLTEFDRNDVRRGVIRRDATPSQYSHNRQRDAEQGHPQKTVSPPFDVVSPDDKFKWTDSDCSSSRSGDGKRNTLPGVRRLHRYSAGNFNSKFTAIPNKQQMHNRQPENGYQNSLPVRDIFKDTGIQQSNHDGQHIRTDLISHKKEGIRISNLKNGLKHVFRKKGKRSDDDSSGQGSESSDNNQQSKKNEELIQTFKDHVVLRNTDRHQQHLQARPSSLQVHYGVDKPSQAGMHSRPSSFYYEHGDRWNECKPSSGHSEPLQPKHRSTSMPFVTPTGLENSSSLYFSLNI
ncbi:uncharacterized protein [Antedon mediterranea]|uniref:uncharacterized protein n=1 Tax=Antedon mediterranea TaxID=105859 RepID=UPI003AF85EBF